MYIEVAWILVSSKTQVQPQIMRKPGYLPDYLSIFYDYFNTDILHVKHLNRVIIISGPVTLWIIHFSLFVRYIFQGGARSHESLGWVGSISTQSRLSCVSSQCFPILSLLCNNRTHYEFILTLVAFTKINKFQNRTKFSCKK